MVTSFQPAHPGQAISGVTYRCSRPQRIGDWSDARISIGWQAGLSSYPWPGVPQFEPSLGFMRIKRGMFQFEFRPKSEVPDLCCWLMCVAGCLTRLRTDE